MTILSVIDDIKLDEMIRQTKAAASSAAAGTQLSGQPWTPELVQFLTVALLTFGIIVVALAVLLLIRGKSADDILRVISLPMVITGAIILVVLGFSNEQMTPVIGLLGTMIGYVLGANRGQKDPHRDVADPAQTTPAIKV